MFNQKTITIYVRKTHTYKSLNKKSKTTVKHRFFHKIIPNTNLVLVSLIILVTKILMII